MRISDTSWDLSFSKAGSKDHPVLCLNFPAPLTRAFRERGYGRCVIEITDAGILLRPYEGEMTGASQHNETVELPEWNGQ